MFVDECTIKAFAGDGGRGCISFRREKYEPWGGPNGGDGGRGGDIVLIGDTNTNNLVDFKFKPHWKAERGEHGQGKDCNGREGKDAVLKLPLGTLVTDLQTRVTVAEVVTHGERIILCKGGNGGWGNTHFKTSTNRAPRRANAGQLGGHGVYRLVLKSIADVGLVGFPNAGKSSLTKEITRAHPKTAAYPFTTLHPQVGVIDYPDGLGAVAHLTIADIPGLIEGASENRGLGHRFLRHIERCALLVIIVDMAGSDGRKPQDDHRHLLCELELYDPSLLKKPRIVVANKMDLSEAVANLPKFKRSTKAVVLEVSCEAKTGLDRLKRELWKRVSAFRVREQKLKAKALAKEERARVTAEAALAKKAVAQAEEAATLLGEPAE
jgi:GTP-binding protein